MPPPKGCKSMRYLFPILSLLLTASCAKKTTEAAAAPPANVRIVAFDETEELAPGMAVRVAKAGATLEFVGVASDNRCPKNVNCVQPGEARIEVLLDGVPRTVVLPAASRRPPAVSFPGGSFRIKALSPYPDRGVRPEPDDFRLRVDVIRTAQM